MITFRQYLEEQDSKTFVFAFGRYSPPTRGHIAHFQAVKDFAQKINAPYTIYVSKTVDHKKNPVPVEEKIAYIKKAIPDLHIEPAVNMFSVLGDIIERGGVTDVVYFAGGDYFSSGGERAMFERLVAEAQKVGINLKVQSSGERTEGISGTALRQAVINNDFKTFLHASPVGIGRLTEQDAARMFEITKQGLAAAPAKKPISKRLVGEQLVLLEKRSVSVMQYFQSLFPKMPEYVLQDLVYKTFKDNPKDAREWLDWVGNMNWKKEVLNVTLDIFTPKSQQNILARKGGSANPHGVPKDSERHAKQQELIQTGPSQEPIIVIKTSAGYDLVEGWHRTIQSLVKWPNGYKQVAWVGQ